MLEQLKDIKSIETIQVDFLPYFFFITVVIILFVVILFLLTKKKKKTTKKQLAKQHLKVMDIKTLDDKQIAYQFTEYGYICLEEHYQDEFIKIVNQLEAYKYKKEVAKIDKDLKDQIKDYIKVRV
jgi:type II secretory pathway component PulF